jgi:hypothetical protein
VLAFCDGQVGPDEGVLNIILKKRMKIISLIIIEKISLIPVEP